MPLKNPAAWRAAHRLEIRARGRAYYAANRDERNAVTRRRAANTRLRVRELKNSPCVDCGVRYPHYVMDFDHRDGSKKVAAVAAMHTSGWATVVSEIAKCDLVCANCHRERTHQRLSERA